MNPYWRKMFTAFFTATAFGIAFDLPFLEELLFIGFLFGAFIMTPDWWWKKEK